MTKKINIKREVSRNQRRRNTYAMLREKLGKSYLAPGLYRVGILRRWYWVAKERRADRVKDMTSDHLNNTIMALMNRHPEETIAPLVKEAQRRGYRIMKRKS